MSRVYLSALHILISYVSGNIDSGTGKKLTGRETNFIILEDQRKTVSTRQRRKNRFRSWLRTRGQQMIAHANRRVLTNGAT